MSTIVTYNRGAQGLPVAGSSTDARLRVWEDFDGPTSKFTLVGFSTSFGAGGILLNAAPTTAAATAKSPKFSGALTTKGDSISFLARAKFLGRAANNVVNELGFGFGVNASPVATNAVLFGMEVQNYDAAADDAFACRVDTNAATGGDSGVLAGKIQSVKGLESFDSLAYFTVGGILLNEGDNYRAQFFINGVLVKETRVLTASSGFTDGIGMLYAYQPVVTAVGSAYIDYIAGDTPR
jgi:hypothetical protein